MKLLTIGGATYDIIINYTDAEMLYRTVENNPQAFLVLKQGEKVEIDNVRYKSGGGATNAAVSFARLGFDVAACFKVGNDCQAQYVVEELQKEEVSIVYAKTTNALPTAVSCIISGKSNDRSVLVYRGASTLLQEDELPHATIKEFAGIYCTSLNGHAMQLLPIIGKLVQNAGKKLLVNPGSNQLKTGAEFLLYTLQYINILLLNTFEASMLIHALLQKGITLPTSKHFGTQTPSLLQKPIQYNNKSCMLTQFFQIIFDQGPEIVIVTNGAEGVYIGTNNTIFFHPSLPVEIVSTLGAGDAFGSGFFAGIMQGKLLEDAIRSGVLNSAAVLQHSDAKTGLLTKAGIEKQLATMDKNLLERFNW